MIQWFVDPQERRVRLVIETPNGKEVETILRFEEAACLAEELLEEIERPTPCIGADEEGFDDE